MLLFRFLYCFIAFNFISQTNQRRERTAAVPAEQSGQVRKVGRTCTQPDCQEIAFVKGETGQLSCGNKRGKVAPALLYSTKPKISFKIIILFFQATAAGSPKICLFPAIFTFFGPGSCDFFVTLKTFLGEKYSVVSPQCAENWYLAF